MLDSSALVATARGDPLQPRPAPRSAPRRSNAPRAGWLARLLGAHEAAWAERWRDSDVAIDGDDDAQQALRFAVYHLISAANPEDERVSIGARALTGDAYRGHVFWDTEIFMLPFYTLTWPEAARALLMYRYHTLPARARQGGAPRLPRRALRLGVGRHRRGDDARARRRPRRRDRSRSCCGTQEQHISADVAYAVWHYWQATGDDAFLLDAGAEILLETARFWASRAALGADGRYHIRGVIGPDEYHESVDDNAFTNWMARWNLERGLESAALLRDALAGALAGAGARLALDDERDRRLARRRRHALVAGLRPRRPGWSSSSPAFTARDDRPRAYAGRTRADGRRARPRAHAALAGGQAGRRRAAPGAAAGAFDRRVPATNFLYYEPRCGARQLAQPRHPRAVAARLGELGHGHALLHRDRGDRSDRHHARQRRRHHIAGLGGAWQAAVLGFAGLDLRGEAISLTPRLPPDWRRMSFAVRWRGRSVRVRIAEGTGRVAITDGEPVDVRIAGNAHSLQGGATLDVRCETRAAVQSNVASNT